MLSRTCFFVWLSLLSGLATASAQLTPTYKPLRTEPLEKYDNPPVYIYRLETSPRMISQYGPFTSYQVNVDANGNNIVGDAANECSISVDPTNRNKMVIGWRQFNSVVQLPAGRLGLHHRWRYPLDLPRCSAKQRFSQRPSDKVR